MSSPTAAPALTWRESITSWIWGASAPAPSQSTVTLIAERSIPFELNVIEKKGNDLPRVFNKSMLLKLETIGTENSLRELIHTIATTIECTAEKVNILVNGKILSLDLEDSRLDETIDAAIRRTSPWGVGSLGLLWVQQS